MVSPRSPRALARVFQHCVLPAAAGPIRNTQCRIASNSSNCTHFSIKLSSGKLPEVWQVCNTKLSNSSFTFLGGFRRGWFSQNGKRSPRSPKNTTSSSCTIFGILKSLRARINKASSAIAGSARLKPPATTSTDFTARKPQS